MTQRWGDAPVHSIGAALFAKKEQIHFFNDIGEGLSKMSRVRLVEGYLAGYRHNPFQHCPQGEAHKKGKCWCNPKENFGTYLPSYTFFPLIYSLSVDHEWYSCLKRYDALFT